MILDRIIADTRRALPERKVQMPLDELEMLIVDASAPHDMVVALKAEGVAVISEIKRASPSKGRLNADLNPVSLAATYGRAGAAALSVLTEPLHFHGSLGDLPAAREGLRKADLDLPLLRKDFIIDTYQLFEARYFGADAVLIIVAALDDDELTTLYRQACDLDMTPLVEVHNRQELERALEIEPMLLGINNRDLHTFEVSLLTTSSLREQVPAEVCLVSESGIQDPEDMRLLAELGVDAALVGEALVTATDPAQRLRQLVEAGR